MIDLRIPQEFRRAVLAERGADGEKWLAELPQQVESCCRRWDLTVDGAVMHGYIALVLPVRRGSEALILKVGWLDDETMHEESALRLWNGAGAVKLVDADVSAGALLLERLDATKTLADIPVMDAAVVAAKLLRRLAIEPAEKFPTVQEFARRQLDSMRSDWQDYGRPFPQAYVDHAEALLNELVPAARQCLVNWDLHYDNVLAGIREPWLTIDPKVCLGDLEFGVGQLLWNRFDRAQLSDRFDAIVEAAQLDKERARGWTIVRCVDYLLWATAAGFTHDPARCRSVLDWMLEHR